MSEWADWEVQKQPTENYNNEYSLPRSSIIEALGQLPARLTEDVANAGINFIGNIPSYLEKSKTEIPGLLNKMFSRSSENQYKPNEGIKNQSIAGLAQAGYNLFNMPHDISNYLTERLELLPENINRYIQMGRMPSDTENLINERYGEPKEPGEALARGIGERSLGLTATGNILRTAPKLTKKNIISDVINTKKQNEISYGIRYKNLFDSARSSNLRSNILPNQIDFDGLGTPTRLRNEYPSIERIRNPNNIGNLSFEDYQQAIKNLGIIEREMEAVKARRGALTDKQSRKYHAAVNAKEYIKNNMFVDQNGNPVPQFVKRHQALQTGYENDVVPYNIPILDKYEAGKATKANTYEKLLKDPFYAQKADEHYIKARERVGKTLKYGGIGSTLAGTIGALLHYYGGK